MPSARGALAMEYFRQTRGHRRTCTLRYWPGWKANGWPGRTVSTARSGERRSCRITSATHQGGSAAASWAAAAITVQMWLMAVSQAAAVS